MKTIEKLWNLMAVPSAMVKHRNLDFGCFVTCKNRDFGSPRNTEIRISVRRSENLDFEIGTRSQNTVGVSQLRISTSSVNLGKLSWHSVRTIEYCVGWTSAFVLCFEKMWRWYIERISWRCAGASGRGLNKKKVSGDHKWGWVFRYGRKSRET